MGAPKSHSLWAPKTGVLNAVLFARSANEYARVVDIINDRPANASGSGAHIINRLFYQRKVDPGGRPFSVEIVNTIANPGGGRVTDRSASEKNR